MRHILDSFVILQIVLLALFSRRPVQGISFGKSRVIKRVVFAHFPYASAPEIIGR
jgi:hypothetical protein